MKKIILFLGIFLINSFVLFGQNNRSKSISGTIIEQETGEPIPQATIQLLSSKDSTFIKGTASLVGGRFSLKSIKPNKYIVKISFMGLLDKYVNLNLFSGKTNYNLGKISLQTDSYLLEETVITANVPEVTVKEDTLVYNSKAYRVPEGSMLEELVKKLPGAEVDEEGNITINGKEIKKIMVDGKEFFVQDPKVAMKNLPVQMIENIKAYERQSDMARITGIDDGEEEAVLDLTVKKEMKNGWVSNFNFGGGSENRYLAKGMVNRFSDNTQISILGNLNNVNDRGFPGGGGRRRWRSNRGLNTKKTFGVNFTHDTKKLQVGGNVNYGYSDQDLMTKTASEMFLSSQSTFAKSITQKRNKNDNFTSEFRIEWKPDSMTNILFRPNLSYKKVNNASYSKSINSDEEYLEDFVNGLSELDDIEDTESLINQNVTNTFNNNRSFNTGGDLQVNRKLNDRGRNLTLRVKYGYGNSDNNQDVISSIRYYKFDRDSLFNRNQLITNEGDNYNYRVQATYSEPIFTNRFLQFSYSYSYRHNETDKNTFDNTIVDSPQRIDSLSKYFENDYIQHRARISLKTIREKYRYNLGFELQPQTSTSMYQSNGEEFKISKNVLNYSPMFDFRYMFSKQSRLRVNYRGRSAQPNINDMLPITDNSNPLNIKEGNPGLKPSYTNTFRLYYNDYSRKQQRGIMTFVSYSNVINSISNKTVYNPETGIRITKPENINGNWNAFGIFSLNMPIKNSAFSIGTFSRGAYNNIVNFTQSSGEEIVKNKTRNLTLFERLKTTYRNDWLEVGLNASINYTNTQNTQNTSNDKETYDYGFGANTTIALPWDVNIASDASINYRKGYSSSLDKSELIWNAQISKSFLKGNAATLSVQFYDILQQQTNLSRSISAAMRQDTEYNAINSYFMVHFAYRFNSFGGKSPGGPSNHRGRGHRRRRF